MAGYSNRLVAPFQSSYWPLQQGRAVVSSVETGINAPKVNVGQLQRQFKKKLTTAAAQSLTLPGLRGDWHQAYTIFGYVKEAAAADSSVFLRPAGASTNLKTISYLARTTDANPIVITDTTWYIGTARASQDFYFSGTLIARSGATRFLTTSSHSRAGAGVETAVDSRGEWSTTTGEVTTLELRHLSAGGLGIGSYLAAVPILDGPRCVIRPTDKILVIGDSLVEGYPQAGQTWSAGVTIPPAWDSFMGTFRRMVDAQCLALSGQTPTWYSAGKGGSKVADIDADKVNRIGAYAPDVIISMVGIVDTNSTATLSAAFQASYQSLITYSRTIKSGCRWIMCSPLARGERADGANGGGSSQYAAGIDLEVESKRADVATVAAANANCWFVDIRGAWQEFEDLYNASGTADTGTLTMEGTHPILPGQEWLAALMLPSVQVMP